MHFAHHLRSGVGLRYLLDFYYMFKKTNIDFDLLHFNIKECKLNILYTNIINSIRIVFDVDFDSSIDNGDISFFINYIIESGIHGFSREKGHQVINLKKEKILLKKYSVSGVPLTSIAMTYEPSANDAYNDIKDNLVVLIEKAIKKIENFENSLK